MQLQPRHRHELFTLLTQGPISRTGLVQATAIRRNTVYDDISLLLEHRLIRETAPGTPAPGTAPPGTADPGTADPGNLASPGRPRIPMGIDPASRQVLGVSFQPSQVEVGRFNLLGKPIGSPSRRATTGATAVAIACSLIRDLYNDDTFSIGVSIPGFIDIELEQVVFSMAFPQQPRASLRPIRDLAGDCPVLFGTESHAMAARWMLTHDHAPREDTLLIYFEDGSLGAAFIVHGRPNLGCINGANELGHNRLNVETETCYCGGVGCLERICDSTFLHKHGLPVTLAEALALKQLDHPAMRKMIDLLAMGFANAINFTRAGHVIVASDLPHSERLIDAVLFATQAHLLPQLHHRIRLNAWPHILGRSATTAAHLALAGIFYEDW